MEVLDQQWPTRMRPNLGFYMALFKLKKLKKNIYQILIF